MALGRQFAIHACRDSLAALAYRAKKERRVG